MSKTVSGQDVEDMLSSVRRLVSNELPPHRRMSRTPDAEKLVLTESQRIAPMTQTERPRSQRLEDRIAELEAAVSKTQDDWEPDGSEDQAQHQPDRIVYTPPSPRSTTRRVSRITLVETSASDVIEETSAKDLSPAELEAVAREALAKETNEHSSFDEALNKAVSKSVEDATAQPLARGTPPAEAPEEVEAEARPGTPLELTPEDMAPAFQTLAPEEEMAEHSAASPKIDVDTLRPIVNKLLREELQGEIGERITRNVRKLVRQEIQRALSLQELD